MPVFNLAVMSKSYDWDSMRTVYGSPSIHPWMIQTAGAVTTAVFFHLAGTKAATSAPPRVIPAGGPAEEGRCIRCDLPSAYGKRLIFGRAY